MIKEGNFLNVCLLKKDKMAASFKKWWFYFRSGLSVYFSYVLLDCLLE
jgi:hypothetical protein